MNIAAPDAPVQNAIIARYRYKPAAVLISLLTCSSLLLFTSVQNSHTASAVIIPKRTIKVLAS